MKRYKTCHAIYRQKARIKRKDIDGSDHLAGVCVCQWVNKHVYRIHKTCCYVWYMRELCIPVRIYASVFCGYFLLYWVVFDDGCHELKRGRKQHIIFSYNKSHQDALFLKFVLVKNSTCFGQIYCPSSGVLILYSQQLVFVILVMLTVC